MNTGDKGIELIGRPPVAGIADAAHRREIELLGTGSKQDKQPQKSI
jgi:hypothetical protein